MFLEQANEGNNDTGRWFAMIIVLLIVILIFGGIPLQLVISSRMSENPALQPNPENLLDLPAYDIGPILGFILVMFPFVLGVVALLLLVKPIHERPMLSVITAHPRFRWGKFFWGAKVWLILIAAFSLITTITGFQKVELQFNPVTLIKLLGVSLVLIPLQAGFEEVLFRGYLMQGFSRLFKYKWLTLLVTSLIFGGLHFFNPEVKESGALIMLPQYILIGLVFGVCTIMDEGIELAWGMHAVNNIFLSVFITQDSSALNTPALFRITEFNPVFDLTALFGGSALFILIAHKRLQWPEWKNLLTRIEYPASGKYILSDYQEDEYEEDD